MPKILALIAILCVCGVSAYADEIDSNQVALCIIGEAEDQGYDGMYAVAHAIRNRGTLKGVYGCKASRVVMGKYDNSTYKLAKKAWKESEHGEDPTKGATHWESIDFKTPYWAKEMKEVAQIKKHKFYLTK